MVRNFASELCWLFFEGSDAGRQRAARERSVVADLSIDRVKSFSTGNNPKRGAKQMSYPGARIYRKCLWCERPFRVWGFLLRQPNRGKFCTSRCYAASRRAFSKALADGRLEVILHRLKVIPSCRACWPDTLHTHEGLANCLESALFQGRHREAENDSR
jgi:hypothetical protein